MVEMFDSNVGAGSVLMPYGGKYQLTETEGSGHKIPVHFGQMDTASLEDKSNVEVVSYERVNIRTSGLVATSEVVVATFPGTNTEYDGAKVIMIKKSS